MSGKTSISIPEFCLVLLVGPSGSGKSTFARKHFKSTEIISSDHYRGVVADDETDQSATADAFDLVKIVAEKRLAARRLTVIDATNVKPEDRRRFVALAKKYHALTVGLVFFVDQDICASRNATRPDRQFGPHVVRNHIRALKRGFKSLQKREGVRMVFTFDSPEEMDTRNTSNELHCGRINGLSMVRLISLAISMVAPTSSRRCSKSLATNSVRMASPGSETIM